jgi:hypothetical protein
MEEFTMRNIMFDPSTDNIVPRYLLNSVPMPEATDTYTPIPHDFAVDLIEDRLNALGFGLGNQQHVLAREGQRYFGMAELKGLDGTDDYGLVLGIRNSYDKSAALTFLLGASVFICSNMSYSAEHIVGRKHTTHILRDLAGLIEEQVRQLPVYAEKQAQRFERYQNFRIHDMTADHLMVRMLRENVISTQRFPKLVQEWHEPSEDHGSKTVWRLFNAATRAMKGLNPAVIPAKTLGLQKIADAGCYYREAA